MRLNEQKPLINYLSPHSNQQHLTKFKHPHHSKALILQKNKQNFEKNHSCAKSSPKKSTTKLNPYPKLVKGFITCKGPSFKQLDIVTSKQYESLVDKKVLEISQSIFHNYSFQEGLEKFSFKLNGFCLVTLPCQIQLILSHIYYGENNTQTRSELRKLTQSLLTKWGENQGLQFKHAVAVDAVYRSTDSSDNNQFRSVSFAHIDFTQDTKGTLKSFGQRWKPKIEQRLDRRLTDCQYLQLNVTKMINLWMPLNNQPHINTLALLDKTTALRASRYNYTALRREGSQFLAQIVAPQETNEWSIFDIHRGHGLLFDSQDTVHSAVHVQRGFQGQREGRQSIQVRILFIDDKVLK